MATTEESIRGDEKKRQTDDRNFFGTLILQVLTAEPADKTAGMIVYADGTTWNPGSGEGIYYYNSSGSWVQLG